MDDLREKTLFFTKVFFSIPSERKVLAYSLVLSLLFGLFWSVLAFGVSVKSLALGLSSAVLVFSVLIPSFVVSAVKGFKVSKHAFFTGLVGLAVFLLFSFIGLLFSEFGFGPGVVVFAVISSALVYLLWFVVIFFAFDLRLKSFLLSLIQPVLFLFFLLFWKVEGFLQPTVFSSFNLFLELLITILIFLLVLWGVEVVINAPTKRNFGVSAVQVSKFFLSQWLSGGRELESLFSVSSERVNTLVSVVSFKKGDSYSGMLVVPAVHYGPLGTLGGSSFPYLIAEHLEKKYGCPVIVFKGAANHDFNPVSAASVKIINKEVESLLKKGDYSSRVSFLHSKVGESMVDGFDVGGKAFLTFSNAPSSTEDIDQALGFALRSRALSFFSDAVVVDRHNSKGEISFFGSDVFERLMKSVETIKKSRSGVLKVGFAEVGVDSKQVGMAGVKAVVLEGLQRYCFIVFDANNCTPAFREKLISSVKGFDFVDLFTTDSHYVNLVKGIHNPLTDESLIAAAVEAVGKAEADLKQCKAKISTGSFQINVLGVQKSSEFIGTMNALISVVKIVVPFLFLLGIAASLIILLFVK